MNAFEQIFIDKTVDEVDQDESATRANARGIAHVLLAVDVFLTQDSYHLGDGMLLVEVDHPVEPHQPRKLLEVMEFLFDVGT